MSDNRTGRGPQNFFMEATIPTSFLFSSICAHCIQFKSNEQYRFGASRFLYDLLCKCLSLNTFKVQVALGDMTLEIPVPSSGMFPSASLIWDLEDSAAQIQRAWNRDCQDQGVLKRRVYVYIYIIIYIELIYSHVFRVTFFQFPKVYIFRTLSSIQLTKNSTYMQHVSMMFPNHQGPLPSQYAVPRQDPRKSWIIGGWGDFIHWASFLVFVLDPRLVSIT